VRNTGETMKKYKFKAKMEAGDRGGAYVLFPYGTGKEFAGRTFLVAALKASMKVVRWHIRREENKRFNPAGFHRYHTILVLECS